MKAIFNGTIITPTKLIKDGLILIKNKKISYVGNRVEIPKDYEIIDASGKFVVPGFVDAHSHVGMITEELDWEYSDVNDIYAPITPHFRAIDGVNLFDPAFKDALEGGVTTVYTGPGSANVIGGVGLVVKTFGLRPESMVIKDFAGVKAALGRKRTWEIKSKTPYPTSKMGSVSLLRSTLKKAKEYLQGSIKPELLDPEEELMYKVLSHVLMREVPLRIHTSISPDEIIAAIKIAEEFNIRVTIDHAFGSQFVINEILCSGVPIVYGPLMISRISPFSKYVSDDIPAILSSRGVKTAIMTDHPVVSQRYLRLSAIVAAMNGMDPSEALKAITINAAEAIGVSDRVGSIEIGKDADLVIFSDHPLKLKSKVEMVFIDGVEAYEAK